jgi:hypothetical protein
LKEVRRRQRARCAEATRPSRASCAAPSTCRPGWGIDRSRGPASDGMEKARAPRALPFEVAASLRIANIVVL